jgi:hypothetical protein
MCCPGWTSAEDVPAQEENRQQPTQHQEMEQQVQGVRRSQRGRKAPVDVYCKYLPDAAEGQLYAIDYSPYAHLTDDPQTLEEVRARPDAEIWERVSTTNSPASSVNKSMTSWICQRDTRHFQSGLVQGEAR